MSPARAYKYFVPLIIYTGAIVSFLSKGILCYNVLFYAWVLIPMLELFIKPDHSNLTDAEEELAKKDMAYDLALYIIMILQIPILFLFLYSLKDPSLKSADIIGRTLTMGMLCGVFGINVGHELGHRTRPFEKLLAQIGLLSSLYMHFFIEHNKGHHKRVATREDPSSARLHEPIYSFYPRTILFGYLHAWQIANREQFKRKRPVSVLGNEMMRMHLIESGFLLLILWVFGMKIFLCYLAAALLGILLLETVNYIEHYGLHRRLIAEGKYERTMPLHSWNSDHIIGRIMLFELSRHSDHHYLASRKYQILRYHENSPQMPTGYPGMMILALFPPLWFRVMDPRVKQVCSPQSGDKPEG